MKFTVPVKRFKKNILSKHSVWRPAGGSGGHYLFSQVWFATVHDVLQADWQEAWHSPQPPLQAFSFTDDLVRLFTCFIFSLPLINIIERHN